MNRRKFLTYGLTATITAAIASPAGIATGETDILNPVDDNNFSDDERHEIELSNFMDEYQIPDIEKARDLRSRLNKELAFYAAGGTFIGSVARSANNEIKFESSRKLTHRAINILGGSGVSLISALPARYIDNKISKSSLSDPDTLVREYEMPQDKAEIFANKFYTAQSNSAHRASLLGLIAQEIFIGPPKDAPRNNPAPS